MPDRSFLDWPFFEQRHRAWAAEVEAWAAAHPERYAEAIAQAAADPYAGEPGREMGARRQIEARQGSAA